MSGHKSRGIAIVAGFFGWIGMAVAAPIPANSPEGYWKTIDDITGKPKSIVRIWKSSDQVLMGKIVRLFPRQGEDANRVCTACQGSMHNQPMVGMVILSGLSPAEEQWSHGKILDPHNGKTYDCSARLLASGSKLRVRGYIGMPLFGRSQTWERVDLMSG